MTGGGPLVAELLVEDPPRAREDKCDSEAVRSWILVMRTLVVWGPR